VRILPRSGEAECRCGHTRAAHQHHRRGSDCSLCPGTCPRFRLRLGSLLERRDEGGPSD
jgi:hypothetical protein